MKFVSNRIWSSVVAGILAVTLGNTAQAQALTRSDAEDEGWRHSITPYLFLPLTTKGTSTVSGVTTELDLSLSDILDALDGALSLRYEGWNGDWGIISELYYVRLGGDGELPVPNVGVNVDVRQAYLSLQGAYRFAHGVNSSGRRYAVDATAGIRMNRLKQEIDLTGPGPGRTFGGTEEWVEPMIGLRYATELNDDWAFAARAELSGFGVNGDDLQYLVLAGFDWQAWKKTSVRFGYQFYGIDYSTNADTGPFAYNLDQNGLYAAISFSF